MEEESPNFKGERQKGKAKGRRKKGLGVGD
jgi:hypothetical protein